MRKTLGKLILAFAILLPAALISQDLFTDADQKYGPDPVLYNGRLYSYFAPAGVEGHQFYESEVFFTGSVVINGITYEGAYLNYDIVNQAALLKFSDETGAVRILEISEAWLDGFTLDNASFRLIKIQGQLPKIYQVLGDGPALVLYYWKKKMKLDDSFATPHYVFTDPAKESFVFLKGEILRYKSNSGFVKIFDPELQDSVKAYLKMHKIKTTLADDTTMTDLINYCNTLLKK